MKYGLLGWFRVKSKITRLTNFFLLISCKHENNFMLHEIIKHVIDSCINFILHTDFTWKDLVTWNWMIKHAIILNLNTWKDLETWNKKDDDLFFLTGLPSQEKQEINSRRHKRGYPFLGLRYTQVQNWLRTTASGISTFLAASLLLLYAHSTVSEDTTDILSKKWTGKKKKGNLRESGDLNL